MSKNHNLSFFSPEKLGNEGLVLFVSKKLKFGVHGERINKDMNGLISQAMKTANFTAGFQETLDILTPKGAGFNRVLIVGLGEEKMDRVEKWTELGGSIMGAMSKFQGKLVSILIEFPQSPEQLVEYISNLALGIQLRQYSFDRYKSKKGDRGKDKENERSSFAIRICTDRYTQIKRAYSALKEVGEGVMLARDLVNQPANKLGTVEFAAEVFKLKQIGVGVEILEENHMRKLRMNALLGVSQGSNRPAKIAIMRWNGSKTKTKPIAFVGKGVVFDTGGISLKPAAKMEDMKGDMGGAAAVTGLMRALAGRKAKINAIGLIGLVENMPDANAQRPGDVVTSMSGQTIEVLNTDAEGRLVLADVLWYTQDRFKPECIVDLATLTGAVIVALGNHHAGMYSNDDTISEDLIKAGLETGEKVWRMPLSEEYDKIIDGTVGDVKNTGGRAAGSVTAAQFLKRFVNGVPWAHLDIAGTAMDSPKTSISKSWASGFGVRLLDQFVKNRFEK